MKISWCESGRLKGEAIQQDSGDQQDGTEEACA